MTTVTHRRVLPRRRPINEAAPTDERQVCLVKPPLDFRVGKSAPLQVAARLEPTDECFRQAQAPGHSFGVCVPHVLLSARR
jgi:hypothetical protein